MSDLKPQVPHNSHVVDADLLHTLSPVHRLELFALRRSSAQGVPYTIALPVTAAVDETDNSRLFLFRTVLRTGL